MPGTIRLRKVANVAFFIVREVLGSSFLSEGRIVIGIHSELLISLI